MNTRQRQTLKASVEGKILIKQARIKKIEQAKREVIEKYGTVKKAWNEEDKLFLTEASKILQPNQNWDNTESIYAVSYATWRRFREAKEAIDAETFAAFCQVLQLKLADVVVSNKDLSNAPLLDNFYGRTQELAELQQWLIQERCRLVLIHGVGGIGKATLARKLVDNIANQYDYIIWRSLNSTPLFQNFLTELVNFLSQGQENSNNIEFLMHYLHQHKCLIVLDDWEDIIASHSEDYSNYADFLKRIAKENNQSSFLILSREKPQIIELLSGKLVRAKKLLTLNYEDAKKILKAEKISGTEDELDELIRRYSNPWILKRIAQKLHHVFEGDISGFVGETSILVDDVITDFLDNQFQQLSELEKNIIYCIAIRRNSASWKQLVNDTSYYSTYSQLFETLNYLIQGRSLVEKNLEEMPILYVLEPVILKYVTNRFVEESSRQILQAIKNKNLQNTELFISHVFLTENPEDDQLAQEQIKRIVKPIQQTLLTELRSQQQVESGLNQILSLLSDNNFSQGYALQNISYLKTL